MRKRKILCSLSVGIIIIVSLFVVPNAMAAGDGATLTITIHEIEQVDDIEWWIDSADWSYDIKIYDGNNVYMTGTEGWINCAENNDNPMPNNVHDFTVTSSLVKVYITLADREGSSYDIADISNRSGGGTDGWTGGTFPAGARYIGTYNLITRILTGDYTVREMGYYKTSGEYDSNAGGEPDDGNDANLWFNVSSDYSIPKASMNVSSISNIKAGTKVNFDGSGSTASTGCAITKYEWDFEGDGSWDLVGLIPITSFTYNNIGTYTAKLRVTDTLDETAILNSPEISVISDVTAKFVYQPTAPTTLDIIQFTDTSTVIGGTLTSWSWSFGDSETSTSRNPTHQYSDGGKYTVKLTVTANDGETDSNTTYITVIELATITGSVKDKDGNPISGATIKLYDTGTTTILETATTNTNGEYTISEISTGTYDIEASKSGYDNNKNTNKIIDSGDNTVDFVLTGEKTPGFELVTALLAIIVVSVILLRKKK